MLPDRSVLERQKLVENAKIQMRYFEEFSNNVYQMIAIEHELNEYEEHEREWRGKDIIVSKSSRSPLALQKKQSQEELVVLLD